MPADSGESSPVIEKEAGFKLTVRFILKILSQPYIVDCESVYVPVSDNS